jgi:hypothetical protein
MKPFFSLSIGIFSAFVTLDSFAQQILKDMNGKQLLETKYVDVKGSPFFEDRYIKGSATLQNKQTFNNLFLRYDQVQDMVYFKNDMAEENAMTFASPAVEFKIPMGTDTAVFAKLATGNLKNDGYYQVLYNGSTTLLKKIRKKLVTKSTYGTSGEEKNISSIVNYFIITANGKLLPFNRETKSILKTLGNKQEAMEKYISADSLDLKKDKDLAAVIAYYDTLN